MFKRPRPGEDEEDILRMQEEFLGEKSKDENLKPAAQVVNLRPQPTQTTNIPKPTTPGVRKQSKYAQSKGFKRQIEAVPSESVIGEILEKNSIQCSNVDNKEDSRDNVYFPKVFPSVLGGIVEKNSDEIIDFDNMSPMPPQGFPVVSKHNIHKQELSKSVFKQIRRENKSVKLDSMDVDEPSTSSTSPFTSETPSSSLRSKSYTVETKEAESIHMENVNLLTKLSEKEILEEQQKLFANLDPKLIEFIKAKRNESSQEKTNTGDDREIKSNESMETEEVKSEPTNFTEDCVFENDVLANPNVNKWIHFDSLEKDKLEWMKGIKESKKNNPNEPYEARFDFKGYLMPYTMDYTEETKTLFHHGDEPDRPGYSITELIELSRSSVLQQRVTALNSLAGILEYHSTGIYKDVIEIPLSKMFFLIRIAMDENKINVLEPALKAMRNLIFNRIDESCLDVLVGFDERNQHPSLENDKSDIEELDTKESELKDFHLAEIDLITALLRTDILQRLQYILEVLKPSFNCVQYSLQILTRLARDSIETATKIVEKETLIDTIVKNFVPTTSLNFAFNPEIIYNGKPVLGALKLLRLLSVQSKETGELLIDRYQILKPLSEYITSGIDGTYGLRIQIEATGVLANLLQFNLGIDNIHSMMPIIVTTMYKHVQGTNISPDTSLVSITHAATVLQLVNQILKSKVVYANNSMYKHQLYPLIKDGMMKWLAQLSNCTSYNLGHLRLISSALNCTRNMIINEQLPETFLNKALRSFGTSSGFKEIVKHLIPSSNLLSGLDKSNLHLTKNLMSLGGCVVDSSQKVLPVANPLSPMPLLATLYRVLLITDEKSLKQLFVENVLEYLTKLADKAPCLCDNWFTRTEGDFLFCCVKLATECDIPENNKDLLYIVANKLCYILRVDKTYELYFLFNLVVFNKSWFSAERLMNSVSLSHANGFSTAIEEIKYCYDKVINLKYPNSGPTIVQSKWQDPILPRDWIYLPLLQSYSRSQMSTDQPPVQGEHAKKVALQMAAEKEFILRCSLEWILFTEICFPDLLEDIDITDRFCRIMCAFLCDNSLFLEQNVKNILRSCIQVIFKKEKRKPFNFDKPLTGLHNFQDFYTQILEQFQSVSYGDHTFAACVLVPLAQKHNIKWRKLLWSEYAGCLRALDCPVDLLCYELNEYLYPEETDESLLRSYFHALSGNLVRPNTIAYRIANHHTLMFKNKTVSS